MVEDSEPDVDFERYLREGDLRTREDVLAWLQCEALMCPESPRPTKRTAFLVLANKANELSARLDRERRRACRRGALDKWRHAADYVRAARTHRDPDGVWWASGHTIYFAVRECLAFRAAARLK